MKMKSTIAIPFIAIFVAVGAFAEEAPDPADLPIPADSESLLDFRGKPTWDYEPYKALFETKTYGELLEGLYAFFAAWTRDGMKLQGDTAVSCYYNCKLAQIRLNYLLREDHLHADKLLLELHPKNQIDEKKADRILAAQVGIEQIRRKEEEIRVMFKTLGEKEDPYPDGPPKDVHQLYQPLFKFLNDVFLDVE